VKKFTYEATRDQQKEVMQYAHDPELLSASKKELREFLSLLSKHFPKHNSEESPIVLQWRGAYSHAKGILDDKRQRNNWRIAIATLVVAIVAATTGVLQYYSSQNSESSVSSNATE